MKKKSILVIFSEIFSKKKRERDYIKSTIDILSQENKIPVKIFFFNKKINNPKELKRQIIQRDIILFRNCNSVTIKKITSLCPEGKIIFSLGDEDIPRVTKVNSMGEVANLIK